MSVEDFILRFNYYYKPAIEKRIKKATTRLKKYNLEEGDVVECRYTDHKCPDFFIEINEIKPIKFRELSNEDALYEGYLDSGLLKQVLKTYYPNITGDTYVYQYRFRYMGV